MQNITEAEINYCTRNFLRANGFDFISMGPNGEKLYYELDVKNPPQLKQPDCIAIKKNTIIIIEEKVFYNSLFKKQNNGVSDIDKLQRFLNNNITKDEFIKKVSHLLNIDSSNLKIIGGCNSLIPERSKFQFPSSLIQLGVKYTPKLLSTYLINGPSLYLKLFTNHVNKINLP